MNNDDFPKELYEKAARRCAMDELCRWQIANKLTRQNASKTDITQVCDRLEEEGFINEERFAKLYAISKLNQNSWGKIKIRYGLKQLHISDQSINIGLQSINETTYETTLKKVIEKARKKHPDDTWEEQQKIIAYAISKGFEMDRVLHVTEKSLKDNF